jgi:hypothetical protein
MKRWSRFLLLFSFVILFASVIAPRTAQAHGLIAGGSQVLEVQAGDYTLRVEAIVPTGAPTQLTLKVLPLQALSAPALLTVVAAQREIAYRSEPYTARLEAGQPLIAVFDIAITAVGNWDLELSYVAGDAPAGIVSIPVTVVPVVTPPLTVPLFVGFALLALTLSLSILWLNAPLWVRTVNNYAFVVVLGAVSVLAGISAWPNVQIEDKTQTPLRGSLPYLTLRTTVIADDAQPQLVLDLFDGSTGLPADDLVLHHQALMHLIVVNVENTQFFHLHPARVAPGQYQVSLRSVPAGQYELAVEVERFNSGSQVLRSRFNVTQSIPDQSPALIPMQMQERAQTTIGEYRVEVATQGPLRAGTANVISVAVFQADQPVAALDYWLGMLGHMLIRSQDGGVFGHVHAASTMNTDFQPVSAPGNQVTFVYHFPYPDSYTIWVQLQVRGEVLTVPLKVTVSP